VLEYNTYIKKKTLPSGRTETYTVRIPRGTVRNYAEYIIYIYVRMCLCVTWYPESRERGKKTKKLFSPRQSRKRFSTAVIHWRLSCSIHVHIYTHPSTHHGTCARTRRRLSDGEADINKLAYMIYDRLCNGTPPLSLSPPPSPTIRASPEQKS